MRKFYSVAISNGIENVRDKMSDQLMVEIPGPQTCSKANSEHRQLTGMVVMMF